ncbi:oxidoreductase [Burkholderia cepacia]|nr:oxidoreductase [Burkholderia cepacia]MCA7928581.1 SDR family NAD(P)-dependent oxidoreductase [Burkholderia cepacia]MCA7976673.1 SDR family NAD(P)-dependent oxidoreductase [Burkholderia cepacia]MCA8331759.1 SDR family NAD(P)-dependent oxidoreductase [Burkholderia cepacia]MDC6102135.1 oxidoreductase [Burkholderia cepacia]
MNTATMADKVVLITGVSSGLGRELAQRLLAEGARVAGTVRGAEQVAEFERLAPGRALGVLMDITQPDAVTAGVQRVLERFGRIDVLANNAGVGTVGAVEETTEADARQIFDVNFFGGLRVIHAVLPTMRRQRSGHIVQFSSIAGFAGYPGLGVYAAAKAATGVLGEALAGELAPLGIHVTVLTIGIFETQFAGRSLAYSSNRIDDYADTPADQFRGFIGQLQGKQPNVPEKGAQAIVDILKAAKPPVHFALGADAVGTMLGRAESIERDIRAWETVSRSTQRG